MSYQFSERFSLRPGFSLGVSGRRGTYFSLGATPVFHPRPSGRLSPYFGLGVRYHQRGTAEPEPWLESGRFFTFSTLTGVEYSLHRRFGLFAEVAALRATGRHFAGGPAVGASRVELRPRIGLTLKLR